MIWEFSDPAGEVSGLGDGKGGFVAGANFPKLAGGPRRLIGDRPR